MLIIVGLWLFGVLMRRYIAFPTAPRQGAEPALGVGWRGIGFAFKDVSELPRQGYTVIRERFFCRGFTLNARGSRGRSKKSRSANHVRQTDGQLVVAPNCDVSFKNPSPSRNRRDVAAGHRDLAAWPTGRRRRPRREVDCPSGARVDAVAR